MAAGGTLQLSSRDRCSWAPACCLAVCKSEEFVYSCGCLSHLLLYGASLVAATRGCKHGPEVGAAGELQLMLPAATHLVPLQMVALKIERVCKPNLNGTWASMHLG
jgi:hypothetical protein